MTKISGTSRGPATLPVSGDRTLGLIFALVAIGVPASVALTTERAVSLPSGVLPVSLVLLLYSGTRLAMLLTDGQPRPIASVVWLFVYVTMAVVPLAQLSTGLYPFLVDGSYLASAQLLALGFAVVYDLGYLVAQRRLGSRRWQTMIHRRVVSEAKLKTGSLIAVGLSAYYVRSIGGIQPLFSSRHDLGTSLTAAGLRTAESQVGSAIVLSLGTVPILIVFICWTNRLLRQPNLRRWPGSWLWWVTLLAFNVVVNNPISNARYWILTVLAGILFSLPHFGRRAFQFTLLGGIVAALIFFPVSDYFRNPAGDRAPFGIGNIPETLSTKDYDQSIMTANGLWWVDHVGHTNGRQLLGSALFFVPRSIWPEKPIDTGVAVGLAMGGPNHNLSSPIWLEFYVDFGTVGALLLAGLLGILAQRGDEAYRALSGPGRRDMLVSQVLIPVLAGYTFILMRGPLLQSMSRLSVILAVCWLLRGRSLRTLEDENAKGSDIPFTPGETPEPRPSLSPDGLGVGGFAGVGRTIERGRLVRGS